MRSTPSSRRAIPLDPALPSQAPVELEVDGGVRIVTANDLDQITPWVLFEQEDWFEGELAWLRRVVQPDWQILDIGANHGVYAASLARQLGPAGRLVACEPSPVLQERLRLTIAANRLDSMTVQSIALADTAGSAVLAQSEFTETAHITASGAGTRVRTETVDRLVASLDMPCPDLIKIDTEGHERPVLDGARTTLANGSPLVMFEVDMRQPEVTLEAGERLTALGYDIYHYVAGLGVAVPLDSCFIDQFALNMLACRPDRAEQLAARGFLLTAEMLADARAAMPPLPSQADLPWPSALATLEAALPRQQGTPAEQMARLEALVLSWLGGLRDFSDLMPHPGRLTSLIRLLWTVGARQAALEAMRPLLYRFEAGRSAAGEAGLPISAPFDGMPAAADPRWADVALIDGMIRLRSHSSFFADSSVLPALQNLSDHPGFTPRMERVRQLLRCRRREQPFILDDPRLGLSRNRRYAQQPRKAA